MIMNNKVGSSNFTMRLFIVFSFVIFAFVSIVSSKSLDGNIDDDWNLFKIKYNKSYKDDKEESFRKTVYMENKLKIDRHNELYKNGQMSFTRRINQFGDLTHDEYIGTLNGFEPSLEDIKINHTFVKSKNAKYPDWLDWRREGYVTEVKNQGQCGSCWTFSTTGALEGQHFAAFGKLVSLSEQQLLDCLKRNNGCDGGSKSMAFQYIIDNGGIDTEDSYPYEGQENRCRYNPNHVGARMTYYVTVPIGDDNLLAAIAEVGPVAVSIDASPDSFSSYCGGVYDDPKCSKDHNHAVLVVGYGSTEDGQAYWIVKNSWGTHWGKDGYMLLSRDVKNMCGVSNYAVYPTL